MVSRMDQIYRSILLTKFFVRGWGKPENLRRIFAFRKVISNRDTCRHLVDSNHPVTITKEVDGGDHLVWEGEFVSPFVAHMPGLLPVESEVARFQMVLPKRWRSHHKPTCLHLAGTGDHGFWRRKMLMAKPLLDEGGIASIMLENPFYGCRKPKDQVRSSLHNVSDLFVMGGCLVLESLAIFHWCERMGFGPLGITGISMGGHMASLAATNWHKPIPLVPCLSWSTASGVFTQGVLSGAINWEMLKNQYFSNEVFREELFKMIHSPEQHFPAYHEVGQKFARDFPGSLSHVEGLMEEEGQGRGKAGQQAAGQHAGGQQTTGQQAGQQAAGQQTAGQQAAGQQTAGQQTPGQQTTGQQTAEQQAAGQQTPRQQTPGQQTTGKQTTGKQTSRSLLQSFGLSKSRLTNNNNNNKNNANILTGYQKAKSSVSRPPRQSQHTPIGFDGSGGSGSGGSGSGDKGIKVAGASPEQQQRQTTTTNTTYSSYTSYTTNRSNNKNNNKNSGIGGGGIRFEPYIEVRDALTWEAVQFMRGIMDECTHLGNFSVPVDPSLVIIVAAKNDGYMPRDGIIPLTQLWPGSELRTLPTGHVAAYLFNHQVFRQAIRDSFHRLIHKYYTEARVSEG